MNKYQDALQNTFKHINYPVVAQEDYDILKELVDKETPMKVINLKRQYEIETEMYRNYGDCPKCNHSNLIGQSRCDECGQKLDWSEE